MPEAQEDQEYQTSRPRGCRILPLYTALNDQSRHCRTDDIQWNVDNPNYLFAISLVRDNFKLLIMSQPLVPARTVSQISRQTRRLFSTSWLVPRLSASSVGTGSRRATPTLATRASLRKPSIRQSPPPHFLFGQPSASFSASSVRRATKVVQNPRTGDDGETLMVSISPRAVEVRLMRFRSSWRPVHAKSFCHMSRLALAWMENCMACVRTGLLLLSGSPSVRATLRPQLEPARSLS